jgi:ankyrin repeat protein
MENSIEQKYIVLRNNKPIIISFFVLLLFFSSCHKVQNTNNSFFKAIKRGDIVKVRLLINKGVDVNAKQKDRLGNTPLITAIENGRRKIVELLLGNGANIEKKTNYGDSPLTIAVSSDDSETASILLAHGANINVRGDEGDTPLMVAAGLNCEKTVNLLLKKGADVTMTNNQGAILLQLRNIVLKKEHLTVSLKERFEIAKLLIEKGAGNETGNSLIWDAMNGHLLKFKRLVKKNNSLNVNDENVQCALMIAAESGHLKVVELLVNEGVNVNTDLNNYPVLTLASENGHRDIVCSR